MNARSLFRLVASIVLFALVLWFIGPARVLASFTQADPWWLAAGFAASLFASLLSALRWHALSTWLGIHAPRGEMILAYWRGVMANTVLPGATVGGDALRALHLQSLGHHIAHAAASVLLDRFSGLWMLVALSLSMTGIAQLLGLLPAAVLSTPPAIAITLALLALTAPLLIWSLSAMLTRYLPSRAAALLGALHARPHSLRQYFAQIFWSGGVQVFSIAAFACGGYGVGLDLAWWQFVIGAGPIFVFAAMPVGIGGWGTREAASALVLGAFGATHDAAVACAILYGLFATLQGFLGAFSLLRAKGKHGTDGIEP
ncbi:MAG: lysylphosphatidylglycerol synthase transmembrane domain-containing protein [Georgfuchsia sp.]